MEAEVRIPGHLEVETVEGIAMPVAVALDTQVAMETKDAMDVELVAVVRSMPVWIKQV